MSSFQPMCCRFNNPLIDIDIEAHVGCIAILNSIGKSLDRFFVCVLGQIIPTGDYERFF